MHSPLAPGCRVGFFGGTFDPIHFAHLECALRAKEQLNLDKVLVVPARNPSFKQGRELAPIADRLEMCTLACSGNPDFETSAIEASGSGVTYSVDTIERLKEELPDGAQVYFVIGSDAYLGLPGWREAERLAGMVTFAVLMRPGDDERSVAQVACEVGARAVMVDCPQLDISSSYIRKTVAKGLSVRYLTPDAVCEYIKARSLYTASLGEQAGEGGPCRRAGIDGDALSQAFYDARAEELKGRVSAKRLRHIEGVAETAAHLAKVYGVDVRKARLAGLLHDWDKGMDDDEVRSRAHDLGIVGDVGAWVVEAMPQVLHGPTAAAALSREFPGIPEDVIQAIRLHTTGAPEMSDLDKVIYIADAIEPGRSFDRLPDLQSEVGRATLDDLFFEVYKFWTMALVEHGVVLHPDTISIWNAISAPRMRKRGGKKKRKEGGNV